MPSIQIKRAANASTIEAVGLKDGEFAYAKDSGKLYIGTNGQPGGNVIINPDGGTASEAAKLSVARDFSITGDAEAPAVSFDGTGNVQLNLTLDETGVGAGTYTKVTVDAKGRVTGHSNLEVADLPTGIPVTSITGLGTAATKNTGTAEGDIPVLGAGGKLTADMVPDISTDYVSTTVIGQANGVASLDSTGKVPTSQLPAYVDDVIEAYVRAAGTALSADWLSETDGGEALTPEADKIYVIISAGDYENRTYRWGGTTYVEISPSLTLGTTAQTAFRGDYGNTIYNATINGKAVNTSPSLNYNDVGADQAGAATAVLGTNADDRSDTTVYGAIAYAAYAESLAEAAQEAADDKVASVAAADNSITIGGSATTPTVAVKISSTAGNSISVQADGLYSQGKVYTAGNGIEISGSDQISAKVVAGNGLSLTSNGITLAAATGTTLGAVRADGATLTNVSGVLSVGDIDCGLMT